MALAAPAARADGDPLFGAAAEPVPVLHFNEDVFDAPPGSVVLLAPAPAGAAAFRPGARAWGLQFHPDADDAVLERWITEYAHEIPDVVAFRAQTEHWVLVQRAASRRCSQRSPRR